MPNGIEVSLSLSLSSRDNVGEVVVGTSELAGLLVPTLSLSLIFVFLLEISRGYVEIGQRILIASL